MHGHTAWHFHEEAPDTLHLDSTLQCQTGVGLSCGNGGGNGRVCPGVIYTNRVIAAVPPVLRETLSSFLSAIP